MKINRGTFHLLLISIFLAIFEVGSLNTNPSRRAVLGTAAGLVVGGGSGADAMVQYWQPQDMLDYVEANSIGPISGPDATLGAMDRAAGVSWMMNIGPEKGRILESLIDARRPSRVLEIGTFLGYSSIRMLRQLEPWGGHLVTIEKDPEAHRVAKALVKRAGVDQSSCSMLFGASGDVLPRLAKSLKKGETFDFVFMDHWKAEYATDLRRLESLGLLSKGAGNCAVLADNVLFPGAPELLTYLNVPFFDARDETSGVYCLGLSPDVIEGENGTVQPASAVARGVTTKSPLTGNSADVVYRNKRWETKLFETPFEYRPETKDAMSFSVARS